MLYVMSLPNLDPAEPAFKPMKAWYVHAHHCGLVLEPAHEMVEHGVHTGIEINWDDGDALWRLREAFVYEIVAPSKPVFLAEHDNMGRTVPGCERTKRKKVFPETQAVTMCLRHDAPRKVAKRLGSLSPCTVQNSGLSHFALRIRGPSKEYEMYGGISGVQWDLLSEMRDDSENVASNGII